MIELVSNNESKTVNIGVVGFIPCYAESFAVIGIDNKPYLLSKSILQATISPFSKDKIDINDDKILINFFMDKLFPHLSSINDNINWDSQESLCTSCSTEINKLYWELLEVSAKDVYEKISIYSRTWFDVILMKELGEIFNRINTLHAMEEFWERMANMKTRELIFTKNMLFAIK